MPAVSVQPASLAVVEAQFAAAQQYAPTSVQAAVFGAVVPVPAQVAAVHVHATEL